MKRFSLRQIFHEMRFNTPDVFPLSFFQLIESPGQFLINVVVIRPADEE